MNKFVLAVLMNVSSSVADERTWTVNRADPTAVTESVFYVVMQCAPRCHKLPDLMDEKYGPHPRPDVMPVIYKFRMTQSWGVEMKVSAFRCDWENNKLMPCPDDARFDIDAYFMDENVWGRFGNKSNINDNDTIVGFLQELLTNGQFSDEKTILDDMARELFEGPVIYM